VFFVGFGLVGRDIFGGVQGCGGQEVCGCDSSGEMLQDLGADLGFDGEGINREEVFSAGDGTCTSSTSSTGGVHVNSSTTSTTAVVLLVMVFISHLLVFLKTSSL